MDCQESWVSLQVSGGSANRWEFILGGLEAAGRISLNVLRLKAWVGFFGLYSVREREVQMGGIRVFPS